MEIRKRHVGILGILIWSLSGCATEPVSYEKEMSIAVWDLEDLSPGGYAAPDMGEILSAKIVETVKEGGEFGVVERERLLLALEELQLGTTLADENTQLMLGRIVGARLMIFGGYQVIQDKLRVDLRLVEVETGRILNSARKTTSATNLEGWLKAAKEATVELLKQKGGNIEMPSHAHKITNG